MADIRNKIILYIIIYMLFLLPYTIHSGIDDVGIIRDVKKIDVRSIPSDIKDLIRTPAQKHDTLLVEDPVSRRLSVVFPNSGGFSRGSVVYLSSIKTELFVDWQTINFFNVPYSQLKVADVDRVHFIAAASEKLISTQFGKFIFLFSKLMFYIGPVLLIILISYLLKQKLSIWMFPGLLSCYSYSIFVMNMISNSYGTTVSDIMSYFGYLFIIALPLTIKIFYYENSPEGQKKIEEFAKKIMEKKEKGIYYRRLF